MANEQPRPPGLYRWDGETFRPAGGPGVGRVLLVAAAAIALLLAGVALGRAGAGAQPATTASTVSPAAATPVPTPQVLSGQGSKVLPVTLAAGRYKVAWTAQGHDNFIVTVLGDNSIGVVNEIPPDPSSGETVLSVKDAATYQLEVQAATLSWTITLTPLA